MFAVQNADAAAIQEAGKTWAGTIAGVLSAGGIVVLLQGGNKIGDLTDDARNTLIILLVVALICAVSAILLAFHVTWQDPTEGIPAKSKLYFSIWLTVIAVACLALTAWPLVDGKEPTPAQNYFVTFTDNSVVCGPLEGDGGALSVASKALTGVAEISEAKSCP